VGVIHELAGLGVLVGLRMLLDGALGVHLGAGALRSAEHIALRPWRAPKRRTAALDVAVGLVALCRAHEVGDVALERLVLVLGREHGPAARIAALELVGEEFDLLSSSRIRTVAVEQRLLAGPSHWPSPNAPDSGCCGLVPAALGDDASRRAARHVLRDALGDEALHDVLRDARIAVRRGL
jgi:hypothetical protein